MDMWGKPLPAGEYTWKGIVRDPLGIKVRLSVHNSGQPGWLTDDISSSWGGDHGNPTTVCALPDGMLLMWNEGEGGHGVVRTDLNGKKIWGNRLAVHQLAVNDKYFFIARNWMMAPYSIRRYELESQRPMNFGNGRSEVIKPKEAEGHDVSGLACDGANTLYVAYGASGLIGVYDTESGDLKKTLKVKGNAWYLAWDAKGKRLLAVVNQGGKIYTPGYAGQWIDGGTWEVVDVTAGKTLSKTNLDRATGIAVDKDGNIYVANCGKLQNVSVFDAKGKYLRSIGKEGGRPARGKYDRNGMYMPGGIAISADGNLWVAETTDSPKRHSVWTLDGAFHKEFFGGCSYNGWVWMDETDPDLAYSHNVEWKIDIDAGTWEPVSTMWRAVNPREVQAPSPNGYAGHPKVTTARNGRRYGFGLVNYYPVFSREEGDVFKPFAGLIRIARQGEHYPMGYEFDMMHGNPEKYPSGVYFWQDKNGDGAVQEDEVLYVGEFGLNWLDRDLNIWSSHGFMLKPTHIDEKGQPFYDVSDRHPAPRGNIYMNFDETQMYTFPAANSTFFGRVERDGTKVWGYRDLEPWQSSLGLPIVSPGRLHGLTQANGVAGEYLIAVSYFGPYHIFTTDGIYAGMILRDSRDGKGVGEDIHSCECDQGQIVMLNMNGKDRYFLLGGANDGRITEILGLDTVVRLEGGTYVHTEEMATKAADARMEYDLMIAKSKKLDIQRGGRANLEKATPVERIVDSNRRFTVKTAYDADNIYFRYDIYTDIGLDNSMGDPTFIFKGGNCIDIQIEAAGLKGDELKMQGEGLGGAVATQVVPGDPRRLLVTRQDGKPLAVLYRTNVPGTTDPVRFNSTSGEAALDAVDDVTDQITLEYAPQQGGFAAVVTVPQKLFGIDLKPQQELTMDVGYIFGNREGNTTTSRAYWSNNGFAANVIYDVPNELLMVPEEWGTASVE